MKILNLMIILLSINVFSQNNTSNSTKLDSILKIDFLSYNYKYLDKTFKINIKEDIYNKSIKNNNFFTNRSFNYADSLNVVLMAEFNDWDIARVAHLQITYTWERIGYYLWKEKDEILEIAKRNNIQYPYRLKELIKSNDNRFSIEIDELRKKMFLDYGYIELKTMPINQLLEFSFKNNSKVIMLKKESTVKNNIRKFVAKHNRHPTTLEEKDLVNGCGKEDCCQKSKD